MDQIYVCKSYADLYFDLQVNALHYLYNPHNKGLESLNTKCKCNT